MLENLKELVSINSYESDDAIISNLKERFSLVSEEVLIVNNQENNNKSILIGLNTKLKDIEPIVLSAHIDTVAPDYEKYNTSPLELTTIGDNAYGLGSIDMKSFVAIILDNVEKIKSINMPVVISITSDEETKLLCIENVINKLKELNIRPKFTIVGEPTKCEINNRANGCFEYQVEVFGKACHSSLINEGKNAICVLSRLITFIEKKQKKFKSLTSNCGVISGGDVVNRVPDFSKLLFDVRSTNSKEITAFLSLINANIKKLIKKYDVKINIIKLLEIPPLEVKNEKIINKIAQFLNVNIDKFMGGCEAGYYQSLSGDAVIFGVGDIALAHKPNEFVNIREYQKYSDLLLKLIENVAKEFK